MSDGSTAIVWFRRDLRLADNPALAAACERADRVVALYIHAPDEEGDWQPGAASRWWLHHSLERLAESLRARGAALHVRRGPTLQALLAVARETGATQVFWNRLYEPAITARDARVAAGLDEAGLLAESFNAALLVEPWETRTAQGAPYRVFTPFWRSCSAPVASQPRPHPAPARIAGASVTSPGLALAELELLPQGPLGCRARCRMDARRARRARPARSVLRARIGRLQRRAQPPRPAGHIKDFAPPALRGDRTPAVPRRSPQRAGRSTRGRGWRGNVPA